MKPWILWLSLFAVACTPNAPPQADSGQAPVVIVTADAGEPELPISYERPVDPRTPTQKAIAACQDKNGKWLCKNFKQPATVLAASNTQPITPTSWTVGDWYINPNNDSSGGGDTCASDGNTCTSATCVGGCSGASCPSGQGACVTFGEVIQHRLGTFFPRLQQITVFHKLSNQALGQDLIFFEPFLGAGGQAKLIDALVPFDGGATAIITDAGFLAKQPDAAGGGNVLQISGLPTGITAGLFVCDVTQGFSCAYIDSVIDAGVAKMQQPLTDASFNLPTNALPAIVEVNSWTPGDTVNIYKPNATNLKSWNPIAGDVSDAGMFSGGWVQFTNVVDLGAGAPPSELPFIGRGENGLAGCKIDPRTHMGVLNGRGNPPLLIGNYHTGTVINEYGGNPTISGGGYLNGITVAGGAVNISGDPIIHSSLSIQANASMNLVALAGSTSGLFTDVNITVGSPGGIFADVSGTAWIYGTGGMSANTGPSMIRVTTWSEVFLTGAITQNSSGTGCVMTGLDAGTITCNIPINLANLTAQHTLKSFNIGSTLTDGTNND